MRYLVRLSLVITFHILPLTSLHAQQRDRLAELNPMTRNPFVTYTSVAPDGSLWMVTMSNEIFHADNIHSPWRTLKEGVEGGFHSERFENIVAFDRNTAVIVGHMWGEYFKRTTTKGLLWDSVKYVSKRGHEWFHSVWRGEEGRMWTGSQDGYLTFSTDSGRTFTTLCDTAFDHKTGIDKIYMLSADSGWIVCHDKSLYSTSDNWRTWHRHSTPGNNGASFIRPWKNYLIVGRANESYYTTAGASEWKRTPLTLRSFEVDPATGMLWALDDNKQVVLMEDIDRWKPMGVKALYIIGIHNSQPYYRTEEGVMRVGADGVVDLCPLLTDERPLDEPEHTLTHSKLLWGYDDKSVYLLDAEGWYRVVRPLNIASLTPDPDRDDRVIVMTEVSEMRGSESGKTFSVDTAGHVTPYTYRQPLAAFVKPGLQSLEITTYKTFGYNRYKETIGYRRRGDVLVETSRYADEDSYDAHFIEPPRLDYDTAKRQLPVTSIERALLTLGERYSLHPTPQDFGLTDTTLDIHKVYYERDVFGSNKHGYYITLVNQEGDTLTAWGNTSSNLDLGFSTHFPWMLPMTVRWRGAEFLTYQPTLWQALREAMPDSMMHRNYLDNSTLHVKDTLQSGDLIFLQDNWSDMSKAINTSTGQYTHVALVERDSAGKVWVIEATPKEGVRKQSFNAFKNRNETRYFGFHIYRLTVPFDTAAVIARANSLIGKPYDNAFLPDNDAYYCSELIQTAFGDLFESKPMNWRDKEGNLPEYWIKHFKELGMPVPEGVPGTNPTDLSRSPLLRKL